MKAFSTKLIALQAICLLLAGCAQTGVPLPPSLELPKPPSDLRVARKGNFVTLTWSEPTLTTDHESVRSLGPTRICRSAEAEIAACGDPVATVSSPATAPKKTGQKSQGKQTTPQTFTDTLPASALSNSPSADFTYAVEVLNRSGRGAGPSNRVHIPSIRTLPAPTDLAAQPNEDGILLTWTSASRTTSQYRERSFGTAFIAATKARAKRRSRAKLRLTRPVQHISSTRSSGRRLIYTALRR